MAAPRILIQTTIPFAEDDWHAGRFSLLKAHLESLGAVVDARDREPDPRGDDPVLSRLPDTDYDQLWLFGVCAGEGLGRRDAEGILAFRRAGGGLVTARDHEDLGLCFRSLGELGAAHYFHSAFPEPDAGRRCADDRGAGGILWPNYHSGRSGERQRIHPVPPLHELLESPDHPSGHIEWFPAHPHEGAVGACADTPGARVVATGRSRATGRDFNLVVAFEGLAGQGRAAAHASFHHFADYNWDLAAGCPSFVTDPPGAGLDPEALRDIARYVENLAVWLSPGGRRRGHETLEAARV